MKMRNPVSSDGVLRLGLETRLETRFFKSRSPRSPLGLGLEGFRSRALRLETLHRLSVMMFCN